MVGRTLGAVAFVAGLLGCAVVILAGSSSASTPRKPVARHRKREPNVYILRHPKREHCKAHYRKRVVTVKRSRHGRTRKVRERSASACARNTLQARPAVGH